MLARSWFYIVCEVTNMVFQPVNCVLCLFLEPQVDSIGSLSISEMDSFPEEVTLSNDSGGLRHCRFLEPRTIGQQVSLKERLG